MPLWKREPVEPRPVSGPEHALVTRARRALAALGQTDLARDDASVTAAARSGVEAVAAGVGRLERARAALDSLDVERAAGELKDARRRLQRAAPNERPHLESLVASAESRYLTVHRLWDRVEAIERENETLVADLENVVAVAAELDARVATRTELGQSVARLQRHLDALTGAYEELDSLTASSNPARQPRGE